MSGGTDIRQLLTHQIYQALVNANSPSSTNPFATISDVNAVSADVTILKNNEYKVTYYTVVSGTSGTIVPPTGATFNADEFGASGNCVLSKIDGSGKPTYISPTTVSGTIVTASLNTSTGAWTASGIYTDTSVALIYSLEVKAIDYNHLTYNNIIETVDNTGNYVPQSRTLTINGTTYDLSANRSWSVSPMVYPSAGIPISTGSAWGSSISGTSSQFVKADGTLDNNTYLTSLNGALLANGSTPLTSDWAAGTFSITGIKSYAISGTGGAGYGEFIAQSSNTSAPSSTGFRFFANSAGSPAWAKKNGSDTYVRQFASTNSADHTYTLPDRDITFDNITTGTTTNGTGLVKGNGTSISFDNTVYQPQLGAGRLYYAQNTDQTVSSSVTETVMFNAPITGGDMGVNGRIIIDGQYSKTGTSGAATIKIYACTVSNPVGNTGTPTSSTLMATISMSSTTLGSNFQRNLTNKNSQSTQKVPSATAQTSTSPFSASTSASTNININTANNWWVVITYTMANSGDSGVLTDAQITMYSKS